MLTETGVAWRRASLGLAFERIALSIENEFQNIEYHCAYTGMFEVGKVVEFRVNGKFRGFIFILRLQLRLFRLGMIRKEAGKRV